jgi:hypothetical protein
MCLVCSLFNYKLIAHFVFHHFLISDLDFFKGNVSTLPGFNIHHTLMSHLVDNVISTLY